MLKNILLLSICSIATSLLMGNTAIAVVCNNVALKGVYIEAYTDATLTSKAIVSAGNGRYTFSGTANTSGLGSVTFTGFEGSLPSITGTGTYSVNSSCGVTITMTMKYAYSTPLSHPVTLNLYGFEVSESTTQSTIFKLDGARKALWTSANDRIYSSTYTGSNKYYAPTQLKRMIK